MLAALSLLIWLYLFFLHGRFWLSGPELKPATPTIAPQVDIIVPARDEAESIGPVITSLLNQDYAGSLRIILVDDGSSDGTVAMARAAAASQSSTSTWQLLVISGKSKPAGWSGKLWALDQGVSVSRADILLLADADVVHSPQHLASLVARLHATAVDMVSEMVRLNCTSLAERFAVPAFVYFFQMLYPFARVNRSGSTSAAAAGGTVLIRRAALERIGGLASIKGALIDDVALAKAVKRGGSIYLGHSGLAVSIRRYPRIADIWAMIARTAFTQLRSSGLLLVLTVIVLALMWLVPLGETLAGHGWRRLCGCAAFFLSCVSFVPTLGRYGRNACWALALPAIALFYMAATVSSALDHWSGRGARWKNRDYGDAS